jgi:hypothetical protein
MGGNETWNFMLRGGILGEEILGGMRLGMEHYRLCFGRSQVGSKYLISINDNKG